MSATASAIVVRVLCADRRTGRASIAFGLRQKDALERRRRRRMSPASRRLPSGPKSALAFALDRDRVHRRCLFLPLDCWVAVAQISKSRQTRSLYHRSSSPSELLTWGNYAAGHRFPSGSRTYFMNSLIVTGTAEPAFALLGRPCRAGLWPRPACARRTRAAVVDPDRRAFTPGLSLFSFRCFFLLFQWARLARHAVAADHHSFSW